MSVPGEALRCASLWISADTLSEMLGLISSRRMVVLSCPLREQRGSGTGQEPAVAGVAGERAAVPYHLAAAQREARPGLQRHAVVGCVVDRMVQLLVVQSDVAL